MNIEALKRAAKAAGAEEYGPKTWNITFTEDAFTKFAQAVELNLYQRYLGALKLLEEASPYVETELADQIMMAHQHAAECHPDRLQHRVVLNRSCIEVKA